MATMTNTSDPKTQTRTVDEVVQALEVLETLQANPQPPTWVGSSWKVRCPNPEHADNHPSASLTEGDAGRILLHCHSNNCAYGDMWKGIKRGLGMIESGEHTPSPAANTAKPKDPEWHTCTPPHGSDFPPEMQASLKAAVKHWRYRNEDGHTTGFVGRYEGEAGKYFVPWTYGRFEGKTKKHWEPKPGDNPRLIYRLDQLVKYPGLPVLMVEGEGTAEAAAILFKDIYVCITTPGGSGAPAKTDLSALEGRDIALWADHDAPGTKYVEGVIKALKDQGVTVKSFRVVKIPSEYPPTWDLADPLPEGVTFEDLQRMIDEALSVSETPEAPEYNWMFMEDFLDLEIPPVRSLMGPLEEDGGCLIFADKGVGKTLVAMTMALGLISGQDVFGYKIKRGRKVAYIDAEMGKRAMHRRFSQLSKGMAIDYGTFNQRLIILGYDAQDAPLPGIDTPEFIQLVHSLPPDIDCVFIDNVRTMVSGEFRENDADAWRQINRNIGECRRRGIAVVIIHHTNKRGGSSGSTAQKTVVSISIEVKLHSSKGGAFPEISLRVENNRNGIEVTDYHYQLIGEDPYTDADGHRQHRKLRWVDPAKAKALVSEARQSEKLVEVIRAVGQYLLDNPGSSGNKIRENVTGGKDIINLAIKTLVKLGRIVNRGTPEKSEYYVVKKPSDDDDAKGTITSVSTVAEFLPKKAHPPHFPPHLNDEGQTVADNRGESTSHRVATVATVHPQGIQSDTHGGLGGESIGLPLRHGGENPRNSELMNYSSIHLFGDPNDPDILYDPEYYDAWDGQGHPVHFPKKVT